MAKRKATAYNRCLKKELKGKTYKNRTAQKTAFKKAVKKCAR